MSQSAYEKDFSNLNKKWYINAFLALIGLCLIIIGALNYLNHLSGSELNNKLHNFSVFISQKINFLNFMAYIYSMHPNTINNEIPVGVIWIFVIGISLFSYACIRANSNIREINRIKRIKAQSDDRKLGKIYDNS